MFIFILLWPMHEHCLIKIYSSSLEVAFSRETAAIHFPFCLQDSRPFKIVTTGSQWWLSCSVQDLEYPELEGTMRIAGPAPGTEELNLHPLPEALCIFYQSTCSVFCTSGTKAVLLDGHLRLCYANAERIACRDSDIAVKHSDSTNCGFFLCSSVRRS